MLDALVKNPQMIGDGRSSPRTIVDVVVGCTGAQGSRRREIASARRNCRSCEAAGVSGSEASAALAGMLAGLVDKLSPDGKLPDSKGIESMIGQFLGRHFVGRIAGSRPACACVCRLEPAATDACAITLSRQRLPFARFRSRISNRRSNLAAPHSNSWKQCRVATAKAMPVEVWHALCIDAVGL
jgi:hypothetical protein